MKEWNVYNLKELAAVGKDIASQLAGSMVVTLDGTLGAGKTALVKTIAAALGIQEDVISPSFGLLHVYPVTDHQSIKQFIHVDTYRLEDSAELVDIGLPEYLEDPQAVTVIEWPEPASQYLAGKHIIRVKIIDDEGVRRITVNEKAAA